MLNFDETHPSIPCHAVAMALSNILVNFFWRALIKGGFEYDCHDSGCCSAGDHRTYGKLVDKLVASCINMTSVDIKVMIAATN